MCGFGLVGVFFCLVCLCLVLVLFSSGVHHASQQC